MELTKKTTILFPPALHERLSRLARDRGVSLGELVRAACVDQYGLVSEDERIQAAKELSRMSLPVTSVRRMKKESVPDPEELVP